MGSCLFLDGRLWPRDSCAPSQTDIAVFQVAERGKAKMAETTVSSTFSILVKSLLGKIISVPVSLDDTVLDLKMKLFALESDFYPSQARLIHDGWQLVDELTLRHYNITSNSIVHHILRCKYQARGGEWPWEQAAKGKGQEDCQPGSLVPWEGRTGRGGQKGKWMWGNASPDVNGLLSSPLLCVAVAVRGGGSAPLKGKEDVSGKITVLTGTLVEEGDLHGWCVCPLHTWKLW